MAEQEVVNYMAKIGVDGSEFTGGIKDMSSSFMTAFGPAGVIVGAAAAAGTAITALMREQGNIARSTIEMAENMGMSADSLQRFHYAANLSGDSISMVDTMLNRLTLNMGKATDATSSQAKAFDELGIAIEGKSSQEVFVQIATALTTMEDRNKAAALSQDILGKSYKESVPYMRDYLENIEEINSKELLTEKQMKQLEKGADAFSRMSTNASLMQAEVAVVAADFWEAFSSMPEDIMKNWNKPQDQREREFWVRQNKEFGTPVDDYGAGSFAPSAKGPAVDPFKDLTKAQYDMKLATEDMTMKGEDLALGLKSNSENVEKLAKDFHEAQFKVQDLTKAILEATKAENDKKNAVLAKSLGVDVDKLVLNPDGTPQKWADGKYKYQGEISQGISMVNGVRTVTSDPTTGNYVDKDSEQGKFNQFIANGGKASNYKYIAPSGANADAQMLQQYGQDYYFGAGVTDTFQDLRMLARDIGKKDLSGDYKSQGPAGWNWNYDNTIANQLRAAYQKGVEGLAAQGITIVNNNNGYATPAEIAAATTKAVSEALAKQVTS